MHHAVLFLNGPKDLGFLVANSIAAHLRPLVDGPHLVNEMTHERACSSPAWIVGVGRERDAGLPETWQRFLRRLEGGSLRGKLIAMFGVDDMSMHPTTYLDTMGDLYEELRIRGARFVGGWPASAADLDVSHSVRHGEFVGLAIDARMAEEQRDRCVRAWTAQIRLPLEDHLETIACPCGSRLTRSAA